MISTKGNQDIQIVVTTLLFILAFKHSMIDLTDPADIELSVLSDVWILDKMLGSLERRTLKTSFY